MTLDTTWLAQLNEAFLRLRYPHVFTSQIKRLARSRWKQVRAWRSLRGD